MLSVGVVVAGRLIRATALADDTRLASRVVRHECRAVDEALCINGAQVHSLSLGIKIASTSLLILEAKDLPQ